MGPEGFIEFLQGCPLGIAWDIAGPPCPNKHEPDIDPLWSSFMM